MDILSREKIIEWIIESGITTNIKLWGQYWSNNKKFRKYHMGVARHGEELAAIYGSSKISISDSQAGFFHERNFEIIASGGFPLVRHVQAHEVDRMNETEKYFKENEEFVLFYSRDDLLDKIRYYLDNPEERGRIAEKGRRIVIDNFSHLATVRKTMDFIKNYYSQ
jgi:spore maturation protein CgeB